MTIFLKTVSELVKEKLIALKILYCSEPFSPFTKFFHIFSCMEIEILVDLLNTIVRLVHNPTEDHCC